MKNNPVAKNAHKANKSAVMRDRKKDTKKGVVKHKGRDYAKEYANYHSDPEQIKRRAARNAARRALRGRKDLTDDKDVHHKDNNPMNNDKSNLSIVTQHYNRREPRLRMEDLRKWFGKGKKGDWVRVGTDGDIKGDCARDPGEGKPKCMPRSKAHSMKKKDRASSARRKRRADPEVDRPGTGNKPIMVKTDKKESVEMQEKINWKMGDGRPRNGARIENDRFWNLPKSQLMYIRKDAHDAMKANPTGRKAGKYADEVNDAATVLAWRKKNGIRESVDLEEKNVPTNPALWSKFKSQAKAKFDVYPSAYANGWASKQYKAAGGGWKTESVKEMKTFSEMREAQQSRQSQLDELSPDTVDSYKNKRTMGTGGAKSQSQYQKMARDAKKAGRESEADMYRKKAAQVGKGVDRANARFHSQRRGDEYLKHKSVKRVPQAYKDRAKHGPVKNKNVPVD
jgi:hypothetical protein